MNTPLAGLPDEFRAKAALARKLTGSQVAAHVWEAAASEVETCLREARLEALTLEEAEVESGYSVSHLRRMLREGKLPNAGGDGEYRILRAHLPVKPGHTVAPPLRETPSSRTQAARAVIQGGSG